MKVLIADKFQSAGIDALRGLDLDIEFEPGLVGPPLVEAIRRAACDILIVRGTQVPEAAILASPRLGLIIRAGAGYNSIDVKAASKRSVFVSNCPGKNAAAVAELVMGLILALDRRIVDATTELREGRWRKKFYSAARGLKGRTLGIAGKGRIGQLVARQALAMGMEVVAWSRSLTYELAERYGVRRMASIVEVAGACDVLTVHLAATPDTQRVIDKSVFDAMKKGAYFINTARGEVVDYDALIDAVKTKDIRVGLDVFENEPAGGQAEFTDRVLSAGGIVYATPHIGASTDQAQEAIADEVIQIVTRYVRSGQVLNCVNRKSQPSARSVLLVRHLNRPGVLAHVLEAISMAAVNVEEMENVICEGAHACCAQISLSGHLSDDVVVAIERGNENILGISQKIID